MVWPDLYQSHVWVKEAGIPKESEMQFTDTNSKHHTLNSQLETKSLKSLFKLTNRRKINLDVSQVTLAQDGIELQKSAF